MSSEDEIRIPHLPLDDSPPQATSERTLLRRGENCPLTTRLVELALGQNAPTADEKRHMEEEGCKYCNTRIAAYRRASRESSVTSRRAAQVELLKQIYAEIEEERNWFLEFLATLGGILF